MFNQCLVSTDLWVPCNNFPRSQQGPKALSLRTPVTDHCKSGASVTIALRITCDVSHGPQPGWLTESPEPFKMLIPMPHPLPSVFHSQGLWWSAVFEINDLSNWERLQGLGTLTLRSLAFKGKVSHEGEQFTFGKSNIRYLCQGSRYFLWASSLPGYAENVYQPHGSDWLPLVWEQKWHVSLGEQVKAAVWFSTCSRPSAVAPGIALGAGEGTLRLSEPSIGASCPHRLQTRSGIWVSTK